MSELAGVAYPIRFFIAVKMRKGYYGLSVFLADRIGDLPKLRVVTDMIFKLSARLKRNGIYHEMIVNVIRVKMGGNNYFVICPPTSALPFPHRYGALRRERLHLLQNSDTRDKQRCRRASHTAALLPSHIGRLFASGS